MLARIADVQPFCGSKGVSGGLDHSAPSSPSRLDVRRPVEAAGAAWASPLALGRMIDNLVDNAARYGGHVTLDARPLGRRVEIMVLDDGPGLAPEAWRPLQRPSNAARPPATDAPAAQGLGYRSSGR